MTDPLGIISHAGHTGLPRGLGAPGRSAAEQGPNFKDALLDELRRVDEMQKTADQAIDDLVTGRRDDLESVLIATQKADVAFRMLLQVRNKVMDAYNEVKQIRV